MATTRYAVTGSEKTFSKKAQAVEAATEIRNDEKIAVEVTTVPAGTVVFALAAPRKIKMSKPYTRTVELPEGVEVPEGFRVAYHRPRRKVAVLHDVHEGYRLLNTATSELSEDVFGTTREAGQAMLSI